MLVRICDLGYRNNQFKEYWAFEFVVDGKTFGKDTREKSQLDLTGCRF